MSFRLLKDADLSGKRVLMRAGFDVPIEDGKVIDISRIEAMVPTMKYILDAGASLILMAHQGRPKGVVDPAFTQKPLVQEIEKLLGTTVQFADSCVGDDAQKKAKSLQPGEVLLLENLRFHEGEKKNDPEFAKQLASLAQVYVSDAFTNAHRDHASMSGVPKLLPSYIGLNMQMEVENLSRVFDDPRRPITLIVSGAKMETKVPVIEHFLHKGDDVLLGGCIANTFVKARGFDVGASRFEEEHVEKAMEIMLESEKEESAFVHVPRDVVVASEATETAVKLDLPVEDIEGDMAIYDIGSITVERYIGIIEKSGTIIWNGPLGLYEIENFSSGTKAIAEAVQRATNNGAFSVIGGGDTLDFHVRYNKSLDGYSFVSTAGGAMLEFLSGTELPGLKALENL